MKVLAFCSPSGLAFTPAALNGVLAGRGMPPSCPAYSSAFPGAGQIPMSIALIEVDQAADVYELSASGTYSPVRDKESAKVSRTDGSVQDSGTPGYLYRHSQALKGASFMNVETLNLEIQASKAARTK